MRAKRSATTKTKSRAKTKSRRIKEEKETKLSIQISDNNQLFGHEATSKETSVDSPLLRFEATTSDLYSENRGEFLSDFRLSALKHSDEMLTSDSEANYWVQLGPTAIPNGQTESTSRILVTGRVTSIVIDPTNPNVIYVGAAQGGVWKTIDGGRNWIAKSDQAESLAIGALVIDPKHPNVLYAGTGEGNLLFRPTYYGSGVLKTINGGETWKVKGGGEKGGVFNGARFFRLAINPIDTKIIFAATSFGIYRSLDGGEEWTPMTKGLPEITNIRPATDIVINPDDPNIVYAAFWEAGIYKTENAGDETPSWKQLTKGLPPNGFHRIALGISSSSPEIIYALMANSNEIIDKFYRTKDGGTSWDRIHFPDTMAYDTVNEKSMGGQGWYNLNVAVDPTTPDTVYLSGIILLKAFRNQRTNIWGFTDIGKNIHTDHHAFAFHPTDNFTIYDGSDGGIYKSTDAGTTWNDVINEGLCITQFHAMDQHPESDAMIIAGTQDNGTEQFRNNSVFYHAADGDGGYVAIDQVEPNIMLHTYYNPTPFRSEESGKFGDIENGGSWEYVGEGIVGSSGTNPRTSLFYPPLALDKSNPKNIAFGTYKIFIDDNQGKNQWTTNVPSLPDMPYGELVSAITYVHSNLIYAASTQGRVFRLTKNGNKWTAKAIHNNPLPSLYIWDITTYPKHDNILIVVMGAPILKEYESRVWRGEVSDDGSTTWKDISGKDPKDRLPNTPVNAVVIELKKPETIYIGTDIGVFRTTNNGQKWTKFGNGLPNCAVFDIRLHETTQLLRATTHGRGMWEIKLDEKTTPKVDLYVRDHLMDTGRFTPSSSGITAAFEDPLQNVKLEEKLFWWMCADIKIDPPLYQMDINDVDYVKFEQRLRHRALTRGGLNRVYVQIHNRGTKSAGVPPADKVGVKLLYANVINSSSERSEPPRFPDLLSDFWTKFYSETPISTSTWTQIGEVKKLPYGPKTLTHTEPTLLAWEWKTPVDVADRVGLLVVVDSPEDPIPQSHKSLFDIENLVRSEKHIGVRLVDVVNM
jgi:photosystem II stability/assembly factor-like uncharacterized protein